MKQHGQVISNDTCDSVIHPYLYKKQLSEHDYNRLTPLFCTQSLEITKIFCAHMRPLCITKEVSENLQLDKQQIDDEIIKKLIGTKVGIARRKIENGIKLNDIFTIEEGVIENIEKYWCFEWATITINNQPIVAQRVFLLK